MDVVAQTGLGSLTDTHLAASALIVQIRSPAPIIQAYFWWLSLYKCQILSEQWRAFTKTSKFVPQTEAGSYSGTQRREEKKKKAAFLFSYFCQANINQWTNSIKHHKNIPYPQERPALAWEYPQFHVPSSFMPARNSISGRFALCFRYFLDKFFPGCNCLCMAMNYYPIRKYHRKKDLT